MTYSKSTNAKSEKDILYYDGNCPLCSKEVCKLSEYTNGRLVLQNIHEMESPEQVPEKSVLLERLHLKTAEGEWLTGIDANVRAWHHTPFKRLWQLLQLPLIRVFSCAAYEFWLQHRQKNKSKT